MLLRKFPDATGAFPVGLLCLNFFFICGADRPFGLSAPSAMSDVGAAVTRFNDGGKKLRSILAFAVGGESRDVGRSLGAFARRLVGRHGSESHPLGRASFAAGRPCARIGSCRASLSRLAGEPDPPLGPSVLETVTS